MSGLSAYLAQTLIGHVLQHANYTAPANRYLALHASDPTDANVTSSELAGAWYGRQAADSWAAAVGTTTNNSNQINYNAVTTSPATVSHWGLYDALTGGNLMASDAFATPRTYAVGNIPVINAGALVLDFSSGFSTYLAQKLIGHVLRGEPYVSPLDHYLAFASASLTKDNVTANELTGAWYARQLVNAWATPAGVSTVTSNSNQINFNAVTGSAVLNAHWGLYDASIGGNLLAFDAWAASGVLNIDDVPIVAAGTMVLDFV